MSSKYAEGRFSGRAKPKRSDRGKKGSALRIEVLLVSGLAVMFAGTILSPLAYRVLGQTSQTHAAIVANLPAAVPDQEREKEIAKLQAEVDGIKNSMEKYQALEARVTKQQEDLAIADSRIGALEQAMVSSDPTVSERFAPPSK